MYFARLLTLICIISLTFLSFTSQAQTWRKEPLTANDKAFMSKQRNSIEELTRRHFGHQLNGIKSNDFKLMQRLLDEHIITASQVTALQAIGVILGDIIKEEQGLSWTIYIDRYGRSRALEIPSQRDVVFPITMVSRRVEVGAKVNISELYEKAISNVKRIKKQIVIY